ncbi:MAG: hypothetical protein ABIX12_00150 [Rubrivivax sp.]
MHHVSPPRADVQRRRLPVLAAGVLMAMAALLALSLALLDRGPAVAPDGEPSVAALAALRHSLQAQDPRRLSAGSLHRVHLRPIDLQLLADHLLRPAGGAARLTLGEGTLDVQASLPLPPGRAADDWRPWLNVHVQLGDGDGVPPVTALRIGTLPLPAALAQWLIHRAIAHLDASAPAGSRSLQSALHRVQWQADGAQADIEWRPDLPRRVLAGLLPAAQRDRLQAQQTLLAGMVERGRGPIMLPALLQPAFALARERSLAPGADPAAESRAALLTLALYVIGRSPVGVVPGAGSWPRARWRPVLLAGRIDFPQHLLVSAVLAAEAGSPLADAIGVAKELSDSRRGSGFSFNDLAINLAGTRLGESAVHASPALQARLAVGVRVDELVPDVSDLPEFLTEAEFHARYGAVGSAAYLRVLADIEARIEALPLWRRGA